MTAKLEQGRNDRKRGARPDEQEVELLEAVVRDNVLAELGTPPGPHRVQVKCLWAGRYRVNVFIGEEGASFKVAHSYFLEADGNGKLLTATPAIARAYERVCR